MNYPTRMQPIHLELSFYWQAWRAMGKAVEMGRRDEGNSKIFLATSISCEPFQQLNQYKTSISSCFSLVFLTFISYSYFVSKWFIGLILVIGGAGGGGRAEKVCRDCFYESMDFSSCVGYCFRLLETQPRIAYRKGSLKSSKVIGMSHLWTSCILDREKPSLDLSQEWSGLPQAGGSWGFNEVLDNEIMTANVAIRSTCFHSNLSYVVACS